MDEYEGQARARIKGMHDIGWRPQQIAEAHTGAYYGPWTVELNANRITVTRSGSDRVYHARATDLLPSVAAQLSLF